MTFPIFVQYVKEYFMPHRLMLVMRWDAEVRIGGGALHCFVRFSK